MKRLLPLLLCAAVLTGCGGARETTDEIKTADPIETTTPIEIVEADPAYPAGDAVDYRWGDAVSISLTLPQGWAWEKAPQDESVPPTSAGVVFYPEDRALDCTVSFQCWLQGFGMCGTGVDFSEYPLPDGRTATLAVEKGGDQIWWTLILPESPDKFTIQFGAPQSVIDAHQAEIDAMLESLQLGELSHIPPQPTTPLVDK